jgi:hypothetical protein
MPLALTLLEPWATLCVLGIKTLETRDWNTAHRGDLYIHASKSTRGLDFIKNHKEIQKLLKAKNIDIEELALGHIIGKVSLDKIRPTDFQNLDAEKHGWLVDGNLTWEFCNAEQITPIKISGKLKLWEFQLTKTP